jgi:hypothetical protein
MRSESQMPLSPLGPRWRFAGAYAVRARIAMAVTIMVGVVVEVVTVAMMHGPRVGTSVNERRESTV